MPLAIVMGLATGGAASAWFAGSSRIPFAAGLEQRAAGRARPRPPALAFAARRADATCAVLAAVFTVFSMVGSSVAEAYQVLLKAAVVIQLIPFIYLFLALAKADGVSPPPAPPGSSGW